MSPTRECDNKSNQGQIVRPWDDVTKEPMTSDDLRRAQNPVAAYVIVGCFVVSVLIAWFA
jgi:hypothetical protein